MLVAQTRKLQLEIKQQPMSCNNNPCGEHWGSCPLKQIISCLLSVNLTRLSDNIQLPHFLKMSTISYSHGSSSPLNKSNPTPLKVKATQSHCSVCRTLISGMRCAEKTGAEIRLYAYASPLIGLWNWKPLVWCVRWWSYDTHRGFTSSLWQPHGVVAQLKSPSRLSTSCVFSTIKHSSPPPPHTPVKAHAARSLFVQLAPLF